LQPTFTLVDRGAHLTVLRNHTLTLSRHLLSSSGWKIRSSAWTHTSYCFTDWEPLQDAGSRCSSLLVGFSP